MSLLDRARAKRAAMVAADSEQAHSKDRRNRLDLVPDVRRVLELDEGRITCDDLTLVYPEKLGSESALYQFDLEGHHFIVGEYWHGNPGRSTLVAVQTKAVRGKPEWPPPHPQSVRNTQWAPTGFVAIYALWQLADALDAAK